MLACSYSSICSGCDWLHRPLQLQRASKIQNLREVWEAAVGAENVPALLDFLLIAPGGLRDRADLMIDKRSGSTRLGLFDRFQTGIVDLQGCPQMSVGLESWLKDFRKLNFPIERGSVRLRVSPTGLRGAWLDFANVDIKRLLEERTTLDLLRAQAVVEIGQKRKRLVERDGVLKLADPILEPWFETYTDDETAVALYCAIGSFTQPGFTANRALVRTVREQVRATGAHSAVEFGAGIGNFTLPLASVCDSVHVYEVDELALEGLRRSLDLAQLTNKVEIHSGNYQVTRKAPPEFRGAELIFVDPPRSGLMKFLDPLEELPLAERPRHFVYVSCFAESFAQDSARLLSLGYQPRAATIVDQFPQSRHYEVVCRYERITTP
jgi:23S rRNA (uracil1939-C5)-methyltransferase